MANRNPKGGQKLTQLSKRKKPLSSQKKAQRLLGKSKRIVDPFKEVTGRKSFASPKGAPRPRDYRKESGAAVSDSEMRSLKAFKRLRKESGAAISDSEMRDFFRFRKTRGK